MLHPTNFGMNTQCNLEIARNFECYILRNAVRNVLRSVALVLNGVNRCEEKKVSRIFSF